MLKRLRLLIPFVFVLLILIMVGGAVVIPVRADPLSQLTCGNIDPVPSSILDHGTGEKPQSKTWTHDGEWWAVFPTTAVGASSSGTWLWRLQQNAGSYTWTEVLKLSDRTDKKADVKVVGNVAHILLWTGDGAELASVEYVGGTYQFWTLRPGLVTIPLLSDGETGTIDIDSQNRMWLASDSGTDVVVYYSDAPYSTWSGPLVIGTLGSSDDISAVTALPNGTIGVLWSSQQNGYYHFSFRAHVDGGDPNDWLAEENITADSSSFADDHVNIAVTSDSTLFAAVKTKSDSMDLIVRRPPASPELNGTWDTPYLVDTSGTRPIVQLNEAAGVVDVIYPTDTGNGGDLVYKEALISNINFDGAETILRGVGGENAGFNDPSGPKDNYSDELVLLYFDRDGGDIEGSFCKESIVEPGADLAITQTDRDDPLRIGDDLVYDVSVSNFGPDMAENVIVTDDLPDAVTFQSATTEQGFCSAAGDIVTCDLGNILAGSTVNMTIVAATTGAAEGTVTNSVSISSTTVDPDPGNNNSSEDTVLSLTPIVNLALNKTVTVSSIQDNEHSGDHAVDGDLNTFWQTKRVRGKKGPANEWIVVDVGSQSDIQQIVLEWEAEFATSYSIEISPDNSSWAAIFSTDTGNGANDTINLNPATARYVRLNTTAWNNTQQRNWLKEIEIYGVAGTPPTPTPVPTATPIPTATPSPTPGSMVTVHVGDLEGIALAGNRGKWNAEITITVHDESHNPVPNMTVEGSWSTNASRYASCVTGAYGECVINKDGINKNISSVTLTVTRVIGAEISYQPSDNHDADGDSDGTAILVTAP